MSAMRTAADKDAWPKPVEEEAGRPETRAQPSIGAEMLLRCAAGAMAALVVSLAWIVAGDTDAETKAWCVTIGASAIMAVTVFMGCTRSEGNRTRLAGELRAQSLRAEIRALRWEIAEARTEQRQRPPGEQLADDFAAWMRGREQDPEV